jgi:uncharacterized protein YdcH (DUF465 family)
MSGNRANASAVNRRVNAQIQSQPKVTPTSRAAAPGGPPGGGRPQQQTQSRGNVRSMQQQPQQEEPLKNPKISISDAIGLVSLRLGRVETMLNSMPNPSELGAMYSNNVADNENYRVVDEAVFTSIVTRLDKLETGIHQEPINKTNVFAEKIDTLEKLYTELKAEITVTKELVMTVQSYAMQTNQKLMDVIVPDKKNDKKKGSTLKVEEEV